MSSANPVRRRSAFVAGDPIPAAPLLEHLTAQAITGLSGTSHIDLVPLKLGNQGQFPYNFQNSSNLLFNALTYNWIAANLMAGGSAPAQLDQNFFTNEYISVLSKVVYSLSQSDLSKLVTAQKAATQQQSALLNAWVQAFGSLPQATPTQQPIDIITSTIATTWASPATTLSAMQSSMNINALLNNTPASGQPVRPVLAAWLDAIGASISLQNQVTMNNAYVAKALAAAQTATAANGGLALDNNTTVPAYSVTPQMSDIQNHLGDPNANTVEATMTVSRASQSEYSVSIQGGAQFSIPVLDFFGVSAGGSASYFSDQIATTSNQVTIQLTFTGLNLVNFGPTAFSQSTLQGWLYMDPIREAIQNGSNDVSGFKFSPTPSVDFSTNGPFGFLTGVAIVNEPTIVLTITSSNFQSILTTLTTEEHLGISFLGIPLASASSSTYSSTGAQQGSSETIIIKMSPPLDTIAGNTNKSVAWVVGAETSYPAS